VVALEQRRVAAIRYQNHRIHQMNRVLAARRQPSIRNHPGQRL